MFFVFYILIITTLQVSNINNFTIKRENKSNVFFYSGHEKTSNFKDVAGQTNGSSFSTYKPLFQIVKNLPVSKSSNLKSNVFDKMLSDEMLSIKQHLYEKDLQTSSAAIRKTSKNSVATPTLVIKQKWPIIEFMSKINGEEGIEQDKTETNNPNETFFDTEKIYSKLGDDTSIHTETETVQHIETVTNNFKTFHKHISELHKTNNTVLEYETRDAINISRKRSNHSGHKLIGLRSLDDAPSPQQQTNPYQTKLCTCMKSHPTTCTHKCTGMTRLRFDKCSQANGECCQVTSTLCSGTSSFNTPIPQYSLTPQPYGIYSPYYVPYQSYIVRLVTDPPSQISYYTNILNDMFLQSTRKRKQTEKRYSNDNLYYGRDDIKESDSDYLEYDAKYKTSRQNLKTTQSNEVIVKINYEEMTDNKDKTSNNAGVYDANQNKFVNNIVEDLKTYYGDTVIKNCYCSSSPQNFTVKILFTLCVLLALQLSV